MHTYIHRYIHNGFGKVIIKGCSLSTCWRCVAHSARPPPPSPPSDTPVVDPEQSPEHILDDIICIVLDLQKNAEL